MERSWAVFRGLTGDRASYAGFQDHATDIWACPNVAFTPANSGCPTDSVRYGAFVMDVTRGADPPTPDGAGLSYTLEILQGVALQAELLSRAGHPGAWARLRPAFDWARRYGAMNLSSVGYHVTWWANERFGWSLPTKPSAFGRVFGFTDWLYGSSTSGTVAVPTPALPAPTPAATPAPTPAPTATPSAAPVTSVTPVASPTSPPSTNPTPIPTVTPTTAPPTAAPTTAAPTAAPTTAPPSLIEGSGKAGPQVIGSATAQVPKTSLITLETPSRVQPGDLLIAAIEVCGRPTIDASGGWQRVRLDANGDIVALATYIRIAGSSEPTTQTWRFSRAEAAAGVLLVVRGADAEPLADSAGRINAVGSSIPGPNATADRDASLVLAFFGAARSTTISPPAGMDEVTEIASKSGRKKATLEVAAGAAGRGPIDGLVAVASGRSVSAAQVLVIRP